MDEKYQEKDLLKITMEIFSANYTSGNSKCMDWLMFVFNSSYIGKIWKHQREVLEKRKEEVVAEPEKSNRGWKRED